MNTIHQGLNIELLQSEKKRTIILIGVFVIGVCFNVIDIFFLNTEGISVRIPRSFTTFWLFPLCVIAFELAYLFYIIRKLKGESRQITLSAQFLNTAIETCLPTIIIMIIGSQFPGFDVMQSAVVFIYFMFIILSTMRLHFGLSMFCGMLASLSYVMLSIYIKGTLDSNDIVKSIILLLCGIAAGFVARQIRNSINTSLEETEQRHKVESMFGQQISMEVAEQMLENEGTFKSKRMNVAVMFIDIRDFTHFATGRTPEQVVSYQNTFFDLVITTVTRHHGIVNQFLGDGCMITFGAPADLENPSQNAFSAALELLKRLELAIMNNNIHPTTIGIGIHTGEAVTGNIGNAARQQYSITGSVVILASRIEQLNKKFRSQLLVSEDVMKQVSFPYPEPQLYRNILLKGFDDPVSIYKIQ